MPENTVNIRAGLHDNQWLCVKILGMYIVDCNWRNVLK
jgi:hypothetical protein